MRIQVISGILLNFMQAATGLLFQDPVVCRFTESNQCYVAVGQQLHLQMPLEEDGFNLNIINKTFPPLILKYRKAQSNPPTPTIPRWQFDNDDKTMILSSAERSDSGTYTLINYDANEKTKSKDFFQLNVEAEVSSVKVSYSCSFSGVTKVHCSADGDNLQFYWTSGLNTVPQLENGNSTLVLDKDIHRTVTCRAENHVSHDHNNIELLLCSGFMGFLCIWLFEVFILLSLLLGTFYHTRIHRRQRTLRNQRAL